MPKSTLGFLGLEFVPANFGNWSGPGYAGGRIIGKSADPEGKAFQDLYFGPYLSGDSGPRDASKSVLARGYFDAGPRNHDLAYEYADRMYGEKAANASTASQNLIRFAADLDLLGNVLKYRSDTYRYIGNGPAWPAAPAPMSSSTWPAATPPTSSRPATAPPPPTAASKASATAAAPTPCASKASIPPASAWPPARTAAG